MDNAQPQPASERRVWSADEDVKIVALVGEHGTRAWSVIAAQLPTRTGKQCRERWHNQLDPNITKTDWSAAEDEALLASHRRFGNKWAEIAKQLAGRTDNQIKNRCESTLPVHASCSRLPVLCPALCGPCLTASAWAVQVEQRAPPRAAQVQPARQQAARPGGGCDGGSDRRAPRGLDERQHKRQRRQRTYP